MMHHTAYTAPRSTPPLARPAANVDQLAARLYAALLLDTPRRAALMSGPGADEKYKDKIGHRFSIADLADHVTHREARRTWAVSLITKDRAARAGCRDYDGDDGQGAALGLAALDQAAANGLTAFAILLGGRAHVWTLYQRAAPACDIAAQLAELPIGDGEIYPSRNCIRLPFGYHRVKGTRGQLVLQSGQRYDLDNPAALAAGLAAVLSLPRNAPPPPAPAHFHLKSTSGAAPLDPAAWASLPSGAALMSSTRYTTIFTRRPQLRTLAAGQRIILPTKHGMRDSGSEQVAVLISNLLSTGRSAEPGGPLIPGFGAPPLAEIRAIALHWHEALRPGYDLDAYKADVDRLIAEYTPAGYAPEATKGYAPTALLDQAAPLLPLAPARATGRRAGQRAAQAERLAVLLAERIGDIVTTAQLAAALDLAERMIGNLLADLRAAGLVETCRAGHGLRVVRSAINCPPADLQSLDQPLAAAAPDLPIVAQESGPEVEQCNKERENTPAPLPGCPAARLADCPAEHPQGAEPRACVLPCPDLPGLPDCPPTPPQCGSMLAAPSLAELVTEAYDSYPQRGPAKFRAIVAHVGPGYTLDQVRAAYEAEKKHRKGAPWYALRAALRALPDVELVKRCGAMARAHANAASRKDARLGWYAARLTIGLEERDRRGLSAIEPTGKRQRKGQAERKAAAAATVERLAEQASLLPRGEEMHRAAVATPLPCAELEIEDYAALVEALAEQPTGYKPPVKLSTRRAGTLDRYAPILANCAD